MPKFTPIGTFKGAVEERGMQFAAEIIVPFRNSEQKYPQKGRFLLVEISPEEWALGRITRFTPGGMLATPEGEDYHIRMQERGLSVPDDLRERKLKYRIQIKLLGVLRFDNNGQPSYAPSHRRMPHLGAIVAFPSAEVLQAICKLGGGVTDIGDFALGEFVYNGGEPIGEYFQPQTPALPVKFNINSLIARRSAVFARAGYGKSNLVKYLIAELYRHGVPQTETGNPVGVLIFDADGEYFWPDHKGRPGLCDVPQLQKHIRIFTRRKNEDHHYYNHYTAGDLNLDIRQLEPHDVMEIALPSDRQEQQNVTKLKGAGKNWAALVDAVDKDRAGTEISVIGKLLGYKTNEQIKGAAVEINAARSNLTRVIQMLHDPNSQVVNDVIDFLREGKVVIIDISLLSSHGGEIFSGLLLRKIFSYNQENFTGASRSLLPVIAVIEEAQSVLGKWLSETSPFVEWVKEGRKYDLGAMLVTQQPGSLAAELLSQTDNWFCFHLLAESDAETLRRFNSHYSPDILAHLVGEPIPGNCYMWSAPKQPFVLPMRVRSFEDAYRENAGKRVKNAPSVSAAKQQRQARQAKDQALAGQLGASLKDEYRQRKLGIQDFNNGTLRGVKEGKLYHIIKNIRPEGEIRSENELRNLLFTLLFGAIELQEKEGATYYCAAAEKWDKILTASGKP